MRKNERKAMPLPPVMDIGNGGARVLVADVLGDQSLVLRGVGEAPSDGMVEGKIVDIQKVAASLGAAIKEASLMSGRKIETALAAIADEQTRGMPGVGVAVIADGEASAADIDNVRAVAVSGVADPALRVLAALEREYEIDGQGGVRQPLGMAGRRLTGRMHLIVAPRQSLENLERCLHRAGARAAQDFIFSGLAAAAATLTDDEKELGVCLVDIGAGTTKTALYAGGVARATGVIPIAGDDIHRDIAHMHHASLEDAERIKREVGLAGDDNEFVTFSAADGGDSQVGKAVLQDIIGHRVDELLECVADVIRRFEEEGGKLSAGVVLVGDGALMPGLAEAARQKLRVRARVGVVRYFGEKRELVASPRFAVAVGLLMHAAASRLRERQAGAGWRGALFSLKRLFQGDE